MGLTVCWLSCDTRPVVQNPVSHVEIVFNFRPQFTCLNVFSKSLHKQGNTTEQKDNTTETVKCLKHITVENVISYSLLFVFLPLNSLTWGIYITLSNVNQI